MKGMGVCDEGDPDGCEDYSQQDQEMVGVKGQVMMHDEQELHRNLI